MATNPKQPSGAKRVAPARSSASAAASKSAAAARRVRPEVDEAAIVKETAARGPVVVEATVVPEVELSAAVLKQGLREVAAVDTVVAGEFKRRARKPLLFAERAREAFTNFKPTTRTEKERENYTFVESGGDVGESMRAVAKAGVKDLAQRDPGRLRFQLTPELAKLIEDRSGTGPSLTGVIPLGPLLTWLLPIPQIQPGATAIAACKAEARADALIAELAPAPTTPDVDSDDDEDGDHAAADTSKVAKFVAGQVGVQMADAAAPESQVVFTVPSRSTQDERDEALSSFELRHGPSDVTSYHDFSSLHIAFESVWTELFDDRLKNLGEELYGHYVRLKDFTGDDGEPDVAVSSAEDIKALLKKVEGLIGVAADSGSGGAGAARSSGGMLTQLAALGGPMGLAAQWAKQQLEKSMPQTPATTVPEASSERLMVLLDQIKNILSAKRYVFDVFAPDSYNFGILVTYRQTWVPLSYQTGDLVATIPLAPKEVRRYTTRTVTKKSRAQKELEDNLVTRRTEASDTSRVDEEIVANAQSRSNFNVAAQESFGSDDAWKIQATQQAGGDSSKTSSKTKKEFHENVLRSAQEFRAQHRIEIDTNESLESEMTTFQELQNPNDELTVTYAFWELQRQFRITEKIYSIQPVILVANDVPAPHEIDDAWLIEHDWILRRVILDDSFRPALDYLLKSFVGAELNIRLLTDNAAASKRLVDEVTAQIVSQDQFLAAKELDVKTSVEALSAAERTNDGFDLVKRIFDPIGITGEQDVGASDAQQTRLDYAKSARDLAERERQRLLARLDVAVSALQTAVDKLSAAIREHYDNVAQIDRLRIHIKENVLYYMQAIWSHEPPDQRYFRLYDIPVDDIEPDTSGVNVAVSGTASNVWDKFRGFKGVSLALPLNVKYKARQLVDVADLDNPLGYKGNYTLFPLKQNNYLTLHMMQDYLEASDDLRLRDPDQFSEYTIEDLKEFAKCLQTKDSDTYRDLLPDIRDELVERYSSGDVDDDIVVVPTKSLYIDAIVGTHPLLEDFKLIHRALDVKKVQAEVRHSELENIRVAARVLKGNEEDPDIDRKIVIESGVPTVTVPVDNG